MGRAKVRSVPTRIHKNILLRPLYPTMRTGPSQALEGTAELKNTKALGQPHLYLEPPRRQRILVWVAA